MSIYPNNPISRAYNIAVMQLCARTLPTGFDVSDQAPGTFTGLRIHYKRTGRVLVWTGASDYTIFDDKEVNYAFRAWHDARHIIGKHDFSDAGERATCAMQCDDIRTLYDGDTADYFCRITEAEIIGQLCYQEIHNGNFPVDQKAFAIAWLTRGPKAAHLDFSRAAAQGEEWEAAQEAVAWERGREDARFTRDQPGLLGADLIRAHEVLG